MDIESKKLEVYRTQDGKQPYAIWFDKLRDARAQALITKRIARLCLGNPGDCKALKDDIYELRIHYGPGLRVYFAQEGERIILLLAGGDKSTQKQDIQKAKEAYNDFKTRAIDPL